MNLEIRRRGLFTAAAALTLPRSVALTQAASNRLGPYPQPPQPAFQPCVARKLTEPRSRADDSKAKRAPDVLAQIVGSVLQALSLGGASP
jgi:hypothetical protein